MGIITGLPAEVIYVRVSRDGYLDATADPLEMSSSRSEPVVVRLETGGTVSGRCVHGDEPVSSFELVWWKDFEGLKSKQEVWDSSEGQFTINRVPFGDITVMALSTELSQSAPEVVSVEDGSVEGVILRFPDAIGGRGKVIDASASRPISGATIERLVHCRGRKIEKGGIASTTDAQGYFEIQGLVPGGNPIDISADGYATRTVFGNSVGGSAVDFGLVPLFPKQGVIIQLDGGGAQTYVAFAAELSGPKSIPDKHFASDGTLRYESLDPGSYTVRIVYPGQRTYRDIAFLLSPGPDLKIKVPIEAGTLKVRVHPEDGQAMPDDVVLCVQSEMPNGGFSCQYYGVPPSGDIEIGRVEGPLIASVESWDGDLRGVTRVNVLPGATPPVEIFLGGRILKVRVIDQSGAPVSGVTVFVYYPSGEAGWYRMRVSDANGECAFAGLSLDRALVSIHKFPEGYMGARQIELRGRGDKPLELVFAPDWDLRVLVVERGVRVSGIDLSTDDAECIRHLPRTTSDEHGIAEIARVSGAGWKVSVTHPGYWPSEFRINPGDPNPFPIQVRRLGSVEFILRTPYGNPASGVVVELESVEMAQSVSSWLQSGRARVSNSNSKTGGDGRLRFDALPNGPYRWRAVTPEGDTMEGEVAVPPQSLAEVEVTAP